jgi:hypothetical protein
MGLFVARSHSRVRKVMTKLAILSSGLCLSVCLSEGLGVFLRSTKTQFCSQSTKTQFCSQKHKRPVFVPGISGWE